MGNTVFVNNRAVTHANGQAKSINFPCVGKTPGPPAPFVPVPYPNISMGSDTSKGAKKVKADGKEVCLKDSEFSKSTGNEAATAGGGIVTSKQKGKSSYFMYSMDVKIEGKEVPRAFDIMAGDS